MDSVNAAVKKAVSKECTRAGGKNGQCRQLSVVILGEISYKCAWLPFWQHLLKHRSVSEEMAMFVDGMAIAK